MQSDTPTAPAAVAETTGNDPHTRLGELGVQLPDVSPPKGSYVPAARSGDLVFVSGQIPMIDGELIATGKVGGEIGLEQANKLSQRCALGALAAIEAEVGLLSVVRVVKVVGFVASAPGFTDQAGVVNGASDLFAAVFGNAGRHARSAVGVAELPLGAPVEIEVVVEVDTAG